MMSIQKEEEFRKALYFSESNPHAHSPHIKRKSGLEQKKKIGRDCSVSLPSYVSFYVVVDSIVFHPFIIVDYPKKFIPVLFGGYPLIDKILVCVES